MESRELKTMLPSSEQAGQQNMGEVRGVVIVSVPGDGKTVCAAFTFQDQQQQQRSSHPPQYTPVPVREFEQATPAPVRPTSRFGKRLRRTVALLVVLGLAAFVFLRAPSLGQLEAQWDEGEEWALVHRLYAKRLISMAPGNVSNPGYLHGDELVERDYGRRKLFERVKKGPNVSGSSVSPVHGNIFPDGLYYMQLLVGTPPKPYYVDVDTGSDLTWLQCNAPCTSCAETPHPLYNPRGAKLVDCTQPVCSLLQQGSSYGCAGGGGQCDYALEYGDSSSTMGVLVSDQISVLLTSGSLAQTTAVFGCSYDQQGSLAQSPSKTDGLIGLSGAKIALPSQLAAQGLVKNVVAHCLAGGHHKGGYLFLGDELVPSWGMTWTPMIQKPQNDNYFVSVSKIQYGFSTLEIDDQILEGNDFIFDSGTSYTYLVSHVYSALMSVVEEGLKGSGLERDESDRTLQYCWRGRTPFTTVNEASRYFQPVTLNFATSWYLASRQMIIIPQSYLIITPQGNVCMGILDSSETGSGINIIGDISLRGHLVVYDNVQHRVGWMPSDCQKPPKARAFTFV